MKLLAFETATEACSVALWLDGKVCERFDVVPRRHAEFVLPWAEQLLAEAGVGKSQLDAIAVGRGPGAFTGVRLAIAVTQGIALALNRPVVAVSTLAALAWQAASPALVVGAAAVNVQNPVQVDPLSTDRAIFAALDARMAEIYAAAFLFQQGKLQAFSAEVVAAPDQVQLPQTNLAWYGVGSGFAAAHANLRKRLQSRFTHIDATALPHAADVARLGAQAFERGEAIAPDRLQPAYLRDQVALTLQQQAQLRGKR